MRFRFAFACLLVLPAGASEPPVELAGGATEIRFSRHLLDDLGISLAAARGTEQGTELELLEFPILETTALELALPSGSYEGPVAGYLSHEGGFELDWQGGHVSLSGFELHPGLPPNAFELRAADGSLVFVLDNPHPQPGSDRGEFLFMDMDLRLSGQLSARLGRPDLEGLAIGEAHVRTRVRSAATAAPATDGFAATCVADFTGPVDVLLESMTSVSETTHDGARVALAPAVRLRNVGTADVPWFRSIAPDGWGSFTVVGQHPLLVMHIYRLADGRIEQIGRSDAKHAFFSGNTDCACQADQVLFNDCTDLYGASTNANREFLAPREEITASTATWTRTGSHFDGTPVDDYRDHTGLASDHPDPFTHRLTAAVADLETPGAEYRVEAWYLVQKDVDIFNSMGHRQVLPTAPGATGPWTFPFVDVGLNRGSALDAWVNPLSPPAGAANVVVTAVVDELDWDGVEVAIETHLKLAVKASPLPTGLYHYEFALMNFDFDPQVDSFSVPIPYGAMVQNAWFGDVDSTSGNDWPVTINSGDVTWQAPVGNALGWGILFNFSFDTNAGPGDLAVTLGVLADGTPAELTATVPAPATLLPVSEIEVAKSGSGAGAVTSLPSGIDCGGDCAELFADGAWLDLAATPTSGSAFARWEESAVPVGVDQTLGFTVGGDRNLVAVFDTCLADVVLDPQTVSTPTVFYACETITAGTEFVVASDVTFRAGRTITLSDGFTVGPGAGFRAELVPEQSLVPPG